MYGEQPMKAGPSRELSRLRHFPNSPAVVVGWTIVLIVGLALLAGACGATPKVKAEPSLAISPSTRLVGGQELQVRISGFPAKSTVIVYECAAVPADPFNECGTANLTTLYTGTNGRASGEFVAQQTTTNGPNGTTITCHSQCVVVGVVIALSTGLSRNPHTAIAHLSFKPALQPNLADTFLQDLSWVSPTQGWALAAQPCGTGRCVLLAYTTDGGSEWQVLPNPPTLGALRFATPTVGYLYGPSLFMTTDGGHSWQAQGGLQVETLAVIDGAVYRVAYDGTGCPGPCQPTLQKASIGSSIWRTLIGQPATPGRSGSAQIVGSGSTLLLATYGSQAGPVSAQAILYRSTDGGGSWQQMPDPCSGQGPTGMEEDLIDLAGAPGGFFAGLCSPHAGSGSFVVTSRDDGSSWQKAGPLPAQGLSQLAAATATTLAVSTQGISYGSGPSVSQLFISTDAGQHWILAKSDAQQVTSLGVPGWLGFETAQVGRWIGDPHSIWTTNDGGDHWAQSPFH